MTENRRIALNIAATYGRSLYALLIGIFSSRWILMALGSVNYGLYNVVGGMTVFITFFNGILATAISRFYTYSVGQAKADKYSQDSIRECQAWFNTALSVHIVVPVVLMSVGYPVGVYLVRSFLTIPPDRVSSCVWVFRFACLSCMISMLNVPFMAMYKAKQYIAELTIYSFATTTLNFFFLFFIVTHPSDWLVTYAIWACVLIAVPQLIICLRAVRVFRECRINRSMLFDVNRIKRLGSFAMWQMIGALCSLLRGQGIAIVINKFFGPSVNAALSVGTTVNAQSNTLASSMLGAFSPAITTAYGARDNTRAETLVFGACKFGVILSLVFVIPLMLELPSVINLWLKEPPEYAIGLAGLMLVSHVIENFTCGHMIAVSASGRIAMYHSMMGMFSLLALPIAVFWACKGGSPYTAVISIIITQVAYTVVRVILARRIVQLPIRMWLLRIVVPIILLIAIVSSVGYLPHLIFKASFLRILITTGVSLLVFLPLTWHLILSKSEREFVVARLPKRIRSV